MPIKVMGLPSTEKPSLPSGQAPSIEKHSQESKSTSVSKFQKGRKSEHAVVELLKRDGFEIVCRNWRTPYGEVDLVASKENALWMLEIKSQNSKHLGHRNPLGFSQRQRLERSAQWIWLQNRKTYKKFHFRLVIVTECGMKWITLPLLYDQA